MEITLVCLGMSYGGVLSPIHISTLETCSVYFRRLQCPPIPALSSADWFFPTRRNTADSAPPLPIQTSPMLSKLHSQSPLRGN